MWCGCGGLVLVLPRNIVGNIVGTRCGAVRMQGPGACPCSPARSPGRTSTRPPHIHTPPLVPTHLILSALFLNHHPIPREDKHKAPSLHHPTPCPYALDTPCAPPEPSSDLLPL